MLKVKIILGADELALEGDLPFCETLELLGAFMAGRDASQQTRLDRLVKRGADANTALRAAVASDEPDPTA